MGGIFFICLSALLFPLCVSNMNCSPYTYENYLGTKTPYRVVANNNFSKIEYPGCKPLKIWMLVRHGTRNPSKGFIEQMNRRLSEIKDLIIENNQHSTEFIKNSDLDALRKWTSKVDEAQSKKLAHEGEDEMTSLAERMQSRFPSVLDNIYSNTSYYFKFTATQRTKRSAQYFAAGLFGKKVVRDIWFPEPLKRDPILRFYKLCDKWTKSIKKNASTLTYRRQFDDSPVMRKTIDEVNKRLSLEADELDFEDVHLMYMTCAFETAWKKGGRSPWCSAFSIDNLKVMEFAEDLKYYWIDGYGHKITYKQACPAFQDLISYFEEKSSFPKATLYFTHSGTLLKIFAHLGLYKEGEHLTPKVFNEKVNSRNWRVSKIDAFGSNIAFVLHKCNGKSKIMTLHQEHIIRLPSCPTSDLCELEKIKSYYRESLEGCKFNDMCDLNLP